MLYGFAWPLVKVRGRWPKRLKHLLEARTQRTSEELLRVPKQVFKPVGAGLEIKSTQCGVMSTALLLHSTQEGMRGRGHIVRELKVDGTSWAEKESFRGKLSSRSIVTS